MGGYWVKRTHTKSNTGRKLRKVTMAKKVYPPSISPLSSITLRTHCFHGLLGCILLTGVRRGYDHGVKDAIALDCR